MDVLFHKGKSIFNFPIKAIFVPYPDDQKMSQPFQFGVSVPKRLHKKAVARNLLKRRIREAFRINKLVLTEPLKSNNVKIVVMFIYVHNELLDFKTIESSVKTLNQRLANWVIRSKIDIK